MKTIKAAILICAVTVACIAGNEARRSPVITSGTPADGVEPVATWKASDSATMLDAALSVVYVELTATNNVVIEFVSHDGTATNAFETMIFDGLATSNVYYKIANRMGPFPVSDTIRFRSWDANTNDWFNARVLFDVSTR
jgi:hypothetical protein